MWRPGGAMWYSLAINPPRSRLSVSSIRPRGQEESVRPPGGPPAPSSPGRGAGDSLDPGRGPLEVCDMLLVTGPRQVFHSVTGC